MGGFADGHPAGRGARLERWHGVCGLLRDRRLMNRRSGQLRAGVSRPRRKRSVANGMCRVAAPSTTGTPSCVMSTRQPGTVAHTTGTPTASSGTDWSCRVSSVTTATQLSSPPGSLTSRTVSNVSCTRSTQRANTCIGFETIGTGSTPLRDKNSATCLRLIGLLKHHSQIACVVLFGESNSPRGFFWGDLVVPILASGLEALVSTGPDSVTNKFVTRVPALAEAVGVDGIDRELCRRLYGARSAWIHGSHVRLFATGSRIAGRYRRGAPCGRAVRTAPRRSPPLSSSRRHLFGLPRL